MMARSGFAHGPLGLTPLFRAVLYLCLAVTGITVHETHAHAADEPSRVVMFVDPRMAALSTRLRQELESLGFEVQSTRTNGHPPGSLDAEARAAGAIAAIRVTPTGGGEVDMTILDRATGKMVSRKVVVSSANDPGAQEFIATRTVELLRASMMELSAPHPPRGDVPVTKAIRALAPSAADETRTLRDRGGEISLKAGPALALGTTDWRPGLHLLAGLSWTSEGRFGLTASVLIPLVPVRYRNQEGEAFVSSTHLRVGGLVELGPKSYSVSFRAMAGIEVDALQVSGLAASPYVTADNQLVAVAPWIGAALRWRVTRTLSFAAETTAAYAFPRTAIRFASHEVVEWGRPICSEALTVELSWP